MIDLITGHQGVAHISADQIASINNAMMDNYGANKVMRLVGGELTANGLTIEVGTGYWRANGFDMEVQEAETIYIDPTAAGLSRIDNIYVEILQDIPTGAQKSEIVTVNGEPSATPTAPEAPTAPELNTDILLQVVPLASVTVTEGAMVMTDLTIAYEMVTPSELEAVETIATGAQTAAGNAQTTANTASTNANHALAMIKDSDDAYSPSKPYKVGEYVIYNNTVYKCKTACSAASWTVNQSNFEKDTLIGAVTELNSSLSQKIGQDNLTSDYIKLDNGLLICWGKGSSGSNTFLNVTLPASYKDTSYFVLVSPQTDPSNTQMWNATYYIQSVNRVDIRGYYGTSGGTNIKFSWCTIGFWK